MQGMARGCCWFRYTGRKDCRTLLELSRYLDLPVRVPGSTDYHQDAHYCSRPPGITRGPGRTAADFSQGRGRDYGPGTRTADGVHACILSDYAKGVLTESLLGALINACRETHIPLSQSSGGHAQPGRGEPGGRQ